MSKRNKPSVPKAARPKSRGPTRPGRILWVAVAVGIAAALVVWIWPRGPQPVASSHGGSSNAPNATASTNATLPSSEVAQAIMVTVELDFGGKIPSIKEALSDIERRHEPEDRRGRTFA